jgi:hypothetical protein
MAPRARREVGFGPSEWSVEGRLGHESMGRNRKAQGAKGPQVVVKDPQRMEIILWSLSNCQVCTLFLVRQSRNISNEQERAMSKSDYEYLLSLPLVLHLPSEHTFLVHAGLLPYDPTLSIASDQQPLSHWPRIPSQVLKGSIPALRKAQELAILEDIKQNTNPWVLLNMRNLRKDNTVSRLVGQIVLISDVPVR